MSQERTPDRPCTPEPVKSGLREQFSRASSSWIMKDFNNELEVAPIAVGIRTDRRGRSGFCLSHSPRRCAMMECSKKLYIASVRMFMVRMQS